MHLHSLKLQELERMAASERRARAAREAAAMEQELVKWRRRRRGQLRRLVDARSTFASRLELEERAALDRGEGGLSLDSTQRKPISAVAKAAMRQLEGKLEQIDELIAELELEEVDDGADILPSDGEYEQDAEELAAAWEAGGWGDDIEEWADASGVDHEQASSSSKQQQQQLQLLQVPLEPLLQQQAAASSSGNTAAAAVVPAVAAAVAVAAEAAAGYEADINEGAPEKAAVVSSSSTTASAAAAASGSSSAVHSHVQPDAAAVVKRRKTKKKKKKKAATGTSTAATGSSADTVCAVWHSSSSSGGGGAAADEEREDDDAEYEAMKAAANGSIDTADTANEQQLGLIDRIAAMLLSRLPREHRLSELEHMQRVQLYHERIRCAWHEEFGRLPEPSAD
jgi:hypothetical protein